MCLHFYIFTSLIDIPIAITSSTVGLKMCAISVEIKMYKSIIKKNRKMHNKIVLLGKFKLDTIETLISKFYSSHKRFVSVNNVLREYNEMKKETKNCETSLE